MIWLLPIIIIPLFYFFALLQNSFFVYFNFLGSVPNFVFILYFTLIFFEKKDGYYATIFYAILAGLFLDIFSANSLGISIALLIIIGLLTKKIQSLLNEKKEDYPFGYFISLFLISFLVYDLLFKACIYFLNPNFIALYFNFKFLAEILYSLIFAAISFFIFKKLLKQGKNTKQNKFF